jgi:pyruvate dehydrogenase E1 component alpha subunit
VGYALALQKQRKSQVVAAFFGDGATEEGVFYESLNFAALHKLPVLFVCENNGYAIHTPLAKRWATNRLCERVATFGISTHHVKDADVLALWELASAAYSAIRQGSGPVFLECQTYRWREHVGPGEDYDSGYRTRDELLPWVENDQVSAIGRKIEPVERAQIDAGIEVEIQSAIRFAESSPFPDPKDLLENVYA